MEFATKPMQRYPPHLRHAAKLPLEIQIFRRYSADMEENANKLYFECTNFNSSMRVAVYAEFGSASCPLDSRLNH